MVQKSMYPNEESCYVVLRLCFYLSREKGKTIHRKILKLGMDGFDLVGKALLDLYDMNGFLNVCEPVEEKPACESGKMVEGLHLSCRMRKENIQHDSISVINLLRSTVQLNSLKMGQALQSLLVVSHLCEELTVNIALLSMYIKLGRLEDARMLFDKMPEKDLVV
ncbi:hypothetical protein Fmac_020880 [Flemingia macrophylla]|uniref:Pentatricopeptide repeat-containing protein n=1 Tax=Flemingia macrophylla TaxID=520843 RepID=A0ABD1LVT8_9FABA